MVGLPEKRTVRKGRDISDIGLHDVKLTKNQ